MLQPERYKILRDRHGTSHEGPVVYWVQRDRRMHDNWALVHAQQCAIAQGRPLRVVFCLARTFLQATLRQYDFMLRGIEELARDLASKAIPFDVVIGHPPSVLAAYVHEHDASLIVTDFEPLSIKRVWLDEVMASTTSAIHLVDAHNIVPCWHASSKLEFAAYTIRPKITRLLDTFLIEVPPIVRHPFNEAIETSTVSASALLRSVDVRTDVAPVEWITPGETAGKQQAATFLQRLHAYATDRNDPTKPAQSDLSPYFHFGQLAPLRLALDVTAMKKSEPHVAEAADAFLEELIIRRELADNFTHYNSQYDSFEGFPAWAQRTLDEHRSDERDHVYELDVWEQARTHDALWNAAQRQLLHTGKLHGYMRMYWAKKILEWSASPEDAMAMAIALNDTYELDGRDPNGYAGIAWSIGGVHDRAWFERPVYGKIRYMNANGCAKKFDVKTYIARYDALASHGRDVRNGRLDL